MKEKKKYFCGSKKEGKMISDKYIRFDWAAKRILRDKANFGVLEGLISVLLNEDIHIVELLESEGNQDSENDKFNRVDIKAKNSKDEIILVEVQQSHEVDYLQRMLYGSSKVVTEHLSLGEKYQNVKKVYSIHIVYFDLGVGDDYLYHGRTEFVGVHTQDKLQIRVMEKKALKMITPSKLFPEYFILRVNAFNEASDTPLNEWMEYLKSTKIKDDTTVPGLSEAREKLQYLMMTDQERQRYESHLMELWHQRGVMSSAHMEGFWEGRADGISEGLKKGLEKGLAEGLEKGLAEGRTESLYFVAKNMLTEGMSTSTITSITGLSAEEIEKLRN